jgi:opacity protein-like surface antigen
MRKMLVLVGVLAAFGGAEAVAQTVGTPVYLAPYRAFAKSELGATLSGPGGGAWALEGAYRYGIDRFDIGIRGGVLSWNDGTAVLAGADVRFRVIDHTEKFPLDGAVTAGIGGQIGDVSIGYIPIGLSLGRRIELDGGVSFVPYIQPVLVPVFGDTSDLGVALGLGVDFKISKQFDLRVTGGIGEYIEGIGIGFAWIR